MIRRARAIAKSMVISTVKTLRISQKRCPACGSRSYFERFNPKIILLCSGCGHAFVWHAPTNLVSRYQSFDYWIKDREHQSIKDIRSGPHWSDFVTRRVQFMENLGVLKHLGGLGRKGSVLEVGCSEGALVEHLASRGFDALGCDLNQEIVERTRALGRQVIHCNFFTHDFGRRFDAVVSFHTFEHLDDIAGAVKRAADLLEPGGALLLELPFGPDEYDNIDHLHFFSEGSCRSLLTRAGLTNIGIEQNNYERVDGVVAGSYVVCGWKIGG
jgi:SAM-dependent methyltransferase